MAFAPSDMKLRSTSFDYHTRIPSRHAGDGEDPGIFAQSVLAMVNAHDARLQAALFNRISPVIWLTLFAMALLSMVLGGE